MSKQKYKYHYFYKITNNFNGHFYYGIHSTNNLDDGYMGSGTRLNYLYKKYGTENFIKEILKFFDSSKEAAEYEAEIVTEELVKNNECYNISLGGNYGWKCTQNTISVKDKDGNTFRVNKEDPKYLSGEYLPVTKGYITGEDNNGNRYFVSIYDERFLTGELHHLGKGKISCKDKNGKLYFVSINDSRYLNKELIPITKGRIVSEETKRKMKENWHNSDHSQKTCWVCNKNESLRINKTDIDKYLNNGYQKGKKYYEIKNIKLSNILKEKQHQQGEKNSQFGTCWIHNDKESIKIKNEQLEEYISNGWIKGRKIKF